MNTPKISVIVPVYNVEKYLSRCIESILSQTFTDFELLLIDDGSTDGSGKICDAYAKTDNRVKVYHTENRGVSAARNLGIKEASADWICFVDSDDWVEEDYLSALLYDGCITSECVVCQSFYVEKELCVEKPYKSRLYPDVILKAPFEEQVIMQLVLNDYSVNIFAKLFNKKVISEHRILFCESTSAFEDAVFLHQYFLYIQEIHLRSSVSYHYMQRKDGQSLTTKKHSCGEWLTTADRLLKTNDQLIKKFSIQDVKYVEIFYNRYGLSQLYTAFVGVNRDNYKEIYRYVRSKKPLFKKYYVPSTMEQKVFLWFFFIEVIPSRLIFYSFMCFKKIYMILCR